MGAPGNPFASLDAGQPQQTSNGNPFASVDATPATPEAPGFWQRAYEGSPIPGVLDAAKQSVTHFIEAPVQGEQTFHEMTDALNAGDYREAIGKAARLLVGSENPFRDAAKSVISGVVKDAHQAGRDIKNKNLAAIPAIGTAASNYVNDVKAGNTSGAIGDVLGGTSSVLPMLLGDEGTAGKASDAASAAKSAIGDAAGKAKALVSEDAASATAQPEVQGAIRDAAQKESNLIRAKEGVGPEAPPSVRDAVENVANAVKARSKAAFATLDEASGGRWQRFDDALSNLRDKIDESAGVDDDAFEKYSQRAKDIEASQNDLVNQLVHDGKIDADMAETAKADYKQSSALYDLSQQIRNSSSGLRPELGEGTPETIDPAKLSPRLNKLYDSGRLSQALGNEGAAQLVKQVDSSLRTKTSAIKTAKLVKTIAKYAGYAGGAAVLGETAGHILGGNR
jgi:hypothetical protein